MKISKVLIGIFILSMLALACNGPMAHNAPATGRQINWDERYYN